MTQQIQEYLPFAIGAFTLLALAALVWYREWIATRGPMIAALSGIAAACVRVFVGRAEDHLLDASFLFFAGTAAGLMLMLAGHWAEKKPYFSVERKWGTLGNSIDGYHIDPALAVLGALAICIIAVVALGFEAGGNDPGLAKSSDIQATLGISNKSGKN